MKRVGMRLLAGSFGVAMACMGLQAREAAAAPMPAAAPADPGTPAAPEVPRSPRFLWGDGEPYYLTPSDLASQGTASAQAFVPTVPSWSGSFTHLAKTYPFTMVGTDPGLGSATTTVPVVIVPLQLMFSGHATLSAGSPVCGGTQSAVDLSLASPLFQGYPFQPGGTDVGTTQYIDAFQRANFWSKVSTVAPDYHVLLSPTVAPVQTVLVPRFLGYVTTGPCANIGKIGYLFFDLTLRRIISRLAIPPTSLTLFVAYNTFLTQGGRCCVLGYHSAMGSGQTYAFASYSDAGVFSVPIEDVHAMSHELGEWLDDPLGTNLVPGWKGGQATSCQFNLEDGDPVTGTAFEATLGPTTYHPEDLVFLPWFARESPSSSVNGWYTFLDSYASPAAACP